MSDHWCIETVESLSYSKNVADTEYIMAQLCVFSKQFGWAGESWDSQACNFFYSIFSFCVAWFRVVVPKMEDRPGNMWNDTGVWEKESELLLHYHLFEGVVLNMFHKFISLCKYTLQIYIHTHTNCVCVHVCVMFKHVYWGTMIKQIWEPPLEKGFGVRSGFKFPCHLSDLHFPMTYQLLVILEERRADCGRF